MPRQRILRYKDEEQSPITTRAVALFKRELQLPARPDVGLHRLSAPPAPKKQDTPPLA